MARTFPLNPKKPPHPTYRVWFHPRLIDELLDHQHPEAVYAETNEALSNNPFQPSPGTTDKVESAKDLRRYAPQVNDTIRIFYGVEEHDVYALGVEPRKTAYRNHNFDTQLNRLKKLKAEFVPSAKPVPPPPAPKEEPKPKAKPGKGR